VFAAGRTALPHSCGADLMRLVRGRADPHVDDPTASKPMMKRIVVLTAVSIVLGGLVGGAATGEARSHRKRPPDLDSYAQKYPYASQRQLRNARAYDRREYFEQDSNAHPVGSRGWWELKERENGDRFRF